ncbi:MAG: phosphate transport system permease protein [Verrucomicrobiota bacterium]|jgi:phosphate transport system permease protein|nr:phosphate transport system permease protein [Verrucomicrobiota bacterium]
MRLETRRLLDRAFSGLGVIAIGVMALALIVILTPIIVKGSGAFVFRSTVEHRKVMFDQWDRGNPQRIEADKAAAAEARQPVYDMLSAFDAELKAMPRKERSLYKKPLRELEKALAELLGPVPGEHTPVLIRQQYGATRWDRAKIKLDELLYTEDWDYSNPDALGVLVKTPRVEQFRGTALEPLFAYIKENISAMMRPRWTFYWQFLFDTSKDSHIFGGIGPEVLGTIYLTLGAMIFAIPMGVIAAIYLCEYSREGRVVSFLRICISTLAGVPSIVFGLFGLAFFLNTIHISNSKSVLAGSLTLSLLILPTVIRASEEAILAVPHSYKEAALSLGSGRWHTVMTVILPAALPGILTGTVISMGRAAGETAPIIFTAAVSVGRPLMPLEALSQPTPALPWNIYNLSTEHEAVDEIRHVQFGMVFTLVALVLLLNLFAIVMRARISKKLRG